MLSFDRDTMLIVGIVMCVAAVAYMYNDMRKTKEDVHAVKTFSLNLMKNLTIEPAESVPEKPQPPASAEEKKDE
jgi:hypothetical protein